MKSIVENTFNILKQIQRKLANIWVANYIPTYHACFWHNPFTFENVANIVQLLLAFGSIILLCLKMYPTLFNYFISLS
jgi:hypothetical protein